jgi:PleD family two-component response regulator
VRANIGVAVATSTTDSIERLLEGAEWLMHEAKEWGKTNDRRH